jgi:hypothetical protein
MKAREVIGGFLGAIGFVGMFCTVENHQFLWTFGFAGLFWLASRIMGE